eukprot:m.230928 g.230928  ORF g.230928 m.230928 type:complete len:72 (-) comp16003_c0_seq1:2204-2419(-)
MTSLAEKRKKEQNGGERKSPRKKKRNIKKETEEDMMHNRMLSYPITRNVHHINIFWCSLCVKLLEFGRSFQ